MISQQRQALDMANVARAQASRLKREVKAGQLSFERSLADPRASPICVFDLLLCLPKVGRSRALKIIRISGVSGSKRIDSLMEHQRRQLVHYYQEVNQT
jgi:hypothetical protein